VNHAVTTLWRQCDDALGDIANWPKGKAPYYLGENKCLLVTKDGIRLPNGLYIRYPKLRWDTSEVKGRYVYDSRKGVVSIWGGAVVENVIQALARIVVGEQMLAINKKYRVVLTVHDAAVCVVPKDIVEEAEKYIVDVMSTPPTWGPTLPVACEAKHADAYGGC